MHPVLGVAKVDRGPEYFGRCQLALRVSPPLPLRARSVGGSLRSGRTWLSNQVSLWKLRVGVGVISHADLPLNGVLDTFVVATVAEVLNSLSEVPDTIRRDPLLAFGEGSQEADARESSNTSEEKVVKPCAH
ncbi:unnamed protein product [Scytosiphon promiscuus]